MCNLKLNNGLLVFLLLVCSCYGKTKQTEFVNQKKSDAVVAIVELFTSQGCSSCPPADALVRKIAAENQNVIVLSYHVDYWNRLGWTDPFSKSSFTDRQRNYAAHFRLESIYTPQIVVNGGHEFVGSDEQRLRTAISGSDAPKILDLQVVRISASTITLSIDAEVLQQKSDLYIALVLPNTTTKVRRGENGGKTLAHINVVHELIKIPAADSDKSIEVKIPKSLQSVDLKAIVFVQRKSDKMIIAVSAQSVPAQE